MTSLISGTPTPQRRRLHLCGTTPAKSLVGWDDYEQKESPERAGAFKIGHMKESRTGGML